MATKKQILPSSDSAAPPEKSEKTAGAFKIVGIGASAGGLEAFEKFFQHMSVDSGMAFVLVPHLDPGHVSLLGEILQRSTKMPVVEAVNQSQVEPNCVYVIPPNRDMEIFHGQLQLSMPTVRRGLRMPIDAFLRSLSEDRKENAVGIIFSGTGTDGTLGMRAILGAGGVTLAQEPSTARYDGMPASVVNSGYATLILPVEKMPEALLTRHGKISAAAEALLPTQGEIGMTPILNLLRSITGHNFSMYKPSTIGRHIERRMLQNKIKDTATYLRFLKKNPAEVHVLFKELLINVTSFFRDHEAFQALKEILRKIYDEKTNGSVLRVWVAGCATGEESYSIAMLLRELMEKVPKELKVQIYSTDLNDEAIAIARAGLYPPNIAQDVTPERLRRFFIKEEAGFRVKKEVREMVIFAVQNLIKDPPFTRLDLLSCRNLLIYLKQELQDKLIPQFHYALNPDGVLFLSLSESIGSHSDLFEVLNCKWKIYRAKQSAASARAVMSHSLTWGSRGTKAPEEKTKPIKEINFTELTQRILVQVFAPTSVVTDYKGNILFVHGDTGKYLRPAPGQPTLNVVEMAREGLALELRAAIYAAGTDKTPVLDRHVQVKINGGTAPVKLSVRPFTDSELGQNLLLISFQDITFIHPKKGRKRPPTPGEESRIEELERELKQLKSNYQASMEEQQASNEEFKSANQELQSTNEELQSTNEELETSQEELHMVNEELVTVNSELQAKIKQLACMQNDMKNLLDNIHVGIIFLDSHLIIRRFTREAKRIYRLVPTDVGRALNDIKSIFEGDDLLVAAQSVLETLMPYERELYVGDENWILARVQPYRTLDNLIDGVVLTFTDITSRIKAISVQQALMLAESIVNTLHEPLVVLDAHLQVVSASQSFYQEFRLTQEETIGHQFYEIGNGLWNIADLRERLENVLQKEWEFEGFIVEREIAGIGSRRVELNANRMIGKSGQPTMILISMEINP